MPILIERDPTSPRLASCSARRTKPIASCYLHMLSLRELQRAFACLVFEDDACVCQVVVDGALNPPTTVHLYRRNRLWQPEGRASG